MYIFLKYILTIYTVPLRFIQPGKPQNAFIESLIGTFRHKCLNSHTFKTIKEARERSEDVSTTAREPTPPPGESGPWAD